MGTPWKKQALVTTIAMLLTATSVAQGQPAAYSSKSSTGSYSSLTSSQTARMNPAMRYFGGKNAQTVYQQPTTGQLLPKPQPVQVTRAGKPFSGTVRSSTITPYLNLDVRQSDVGLPNYYAFVRPKLEQQRTNQRQRQRMQRMQSELRMASTPGIMSSEGGIPTTGHSTQFLNMGNYFPGK
jgi:hypothetical protein